MLLPLSPARDHRARYRPGSLDHAAEHRIGVDHAGPAIDCQMELPRPHAQQQQVPRVSRVHRHQPERVSDCPYPLHIAAAQRIIARRFRFERPCGQPHTIQPRRRIAPV
ncbi:hypothetical protein [Sphingomonas soli]|uniref:hypothetical protein n=1 Tax=Sphingomonas soli TaxID=266127 RepID=UPI0012EE20F7